MSEDLDRAIENRNCSWNEQLHGQLAGVMLLIIQPHKHVVTMKDSSHILRVKSEPVPISCAGADSPVAKLLEV